MKKYLQNIQDFYINLGYRGINLRKALEKDKEYQKILEERRKKLGKKVKLSDKEKKYVLSTKNDFEILAKCNQLEKMKLKKEDKFLVKFIKSQLVLEWRKPVLKTLNKLLKYYKNKK